MDRVLQSLRLGPHLVTVVEYPDDEGGSLVVLVIDGMVVTEPPLESVPTTDEVIRMYAAWRAGVDR